MYSRASRFALPPPSMLLFPREINGFVGNGSSSGGAWPTANLALYLPFASPMDVTVASVRVACTTGNSAGRNYDIGIFSEAGTKLASLGSTLIAAGVNTWSPNFPIVGGVRYYLGMSVNTTSTNFYSRSGLSTSVLRAVGVAQEASAFPLPSAFTLAQVGQATFPIVVLSLAA